MKMWEYTCTELKTPVWNGEDLPTQIRITERRLLALLNQYGAEGWELIGDVHGAKMWFKRSVEEQPT
jgi:hypothetical protein